MCMLGLLLGQSLIVTGITVIMLHAKTSPSRAHDHYAEEEERVTSHLPETGRITRQYYL